jgi:hypothetical protein
VSEGSNLSAHVALKYMAFARTILASPPPLSASGETRSRMRPRARGLRDESVHLSCRCLRLVHVKQHYSFAITYSHYCSIISFVVHVLHFYL